jgi:hypothetical protein
MLSMAEAAQYSHNKVPASSASHAQVISQPFTKPRGIIITFVTLDPFLNPLESSRIKM